MSSSLSIRRIVLGTVFVLLVLTDLSLVWKALEWIWIGDEFSALGLGGGKSFGYGIAVIQIPAILVLLWLTVVVWNAMQR